jgi:hypothetical protein
MKPAVILPKGRAAQKPPHSAPCNNCGICCEATLCPLGAFLFKRQLGPCPALGYDTEGKSYCGLVAKPMDYGRRQVLTHGHNKVVDAALHLIGASDCPGCDCRINGEPTNHDFHSKLREIGRKTEGITRRARRVWGL